MQPSNSKKDLLDVFVSAVTVVHADTTDIVGLISAGQELLARNYTNYELVVVDNGLPLQDLATVRTLIRDVPCVRMLRLSRKFPFDTAVFAGLDTAIGDYVVFLEAERDPIRLLPDFVDQLRRGSDIVQGISTEVIGKGVVSRVGRSLFYWYNKRGIGLTIPSQATYFAGFTRRSINSLLSSGRQYRYLRHLMRHIGYEITELPYQTEPGHERPRGIVGGARDAVEMVTSYSIRPLRLAAVGGLAVALLNLVYAFYVLITFFLDPSVERGWTTTNLQLSVMFFFVFLSLAVMSEYVARLIAETRREPSYFVMEELTSDRLISDKSRRNIV